MITPSQLLTTARRAARRAVAPVYRRVLHLAARGVVRLVSDSAKLQTVQLELLAGELRSKLERFQNYGLTSRPHEGAEALAIFLGGNRDHGIVVAVDDRRYRLVGLEAGEVALYDDLGSKVHLLRGGEVRVDAAATVRVVAPTVRLEASSEVRMVAPTVYVDGDLEVLGDVTDDYSGDAHTMEAARATYNTHTHDENDSGGPTDGPNQTI